MKKIANKKQHQSRSSLVPPQTADEIEQHMFEFKQAGMPGAFASTDATHIIHETCNWKSRRKGNL